MLINQGEVFQREISTPIVGAHVEFQDRSALVELESFGMPDTSGT